MDAVKETEKDSYRKQIEDSQQATTVNENKPRLSSASMTSQALGGSKIGSGVTDLPTITGRRPLSKALLPREQRRASAAYQPVIGSSLAFLGSGLGASKPPSFNASQRRSSISTYYPLRPGMNTTSRLGSTSSRQISDVPDGASKIEHNGEECLSTQRLSDVTAYRRGSLSTDLLSPTSRRPVVVEESIYPMLRSAFSKDKDEIEERELARLRIVTDRRVPERPVSANIESLSREHTSIADIPEDCDKDLKQDDGRLSPIDDSSLSVIRSPRFIGLTKALANQDSSLIANKMQKHRETSASAYNGNSRSPAVPVKVLSSSAISHCSSAAHEHRATSSQGENNSTDSSDLSTGLEESDSLTNRNDRALGVDEGQSDSLNASPRSADRSGQSSGSGEGDSWYKPIPSTPRRTISTPKPSAGAPSAVTDTPYSNFFENLQASPDNAEINSSRSEVARLDGSEFVVEFNVSSLDSGNVKLTSNTVPNTVPSTVPNTVPSTVHLSKSEPDSLKDNEISNAYPDERNLKTSSEEPRSISSYDPSKTPTLTKPNFGSHFEDQNLDTKESQSKEASISSQSSPSTSEVNNNSTLENVSQNTSHLDESSPLPCLPNAPPPPIPSSQQPPLIGQNCNDDRVTEWSLLGDDNDVMSPVRGHQHRATDSVITEDSGMGDRSSDAGLTGIDGGSDAGLTGTDGGSDAGADSVGHDGAQYSSDEEAGFEKNVGLAKRVIDSSSEGRGSMCGSPLPRSLTGVTPCSPGGADPATPELGTADEKPIKEDTPVDHFNKVVTLQDSSLGTGKVCIHETHLSETCSVPDQRHCNGLQGDPVLNKPAYQSNKEDAEKDIDVELENSSTETKAERADREDDAGILRGKAGDDNASETGIDIEVYESSDNDQIELDGDETNEESQAAFESEITPWEAQAVTEVSGIPPEGKTMPEESVVAVDNVTKCSANTSDAADATAVEAPVPAVEAPVPAVEAVEINTARSCSEAEKAAAESAAALELKTVTECELLGELEASADLVLDAATSETKTEVTAAVGKEIANEKLETTATSKSEVSEQFATAADDVHDVPTEAGGLGAKAGVEYEAAAEVTKTPEVTLRAEAGVPNIKKAPPAVEPKSETSAAELTAVLPSEGNISDARAADLNRAPLERGLDTLTDASNGSGKTSDPKDESPSCLGMSGETLTVEVQKGNLGLGFCIEGGVGSAAGDRPISVKRIFKGHPGVQDVLQPGDVILRANDKDLSSCSQYDAWNYLKALPEGAVTLQIHKNRLTQSTFN